MYRKIKSSISELDVETNTDQRIQRLKPLIQFVQNKITATQQIRLHFICTHNSRRSHFAQVWAQTLAYHFNIKNVFCYSGGTESTVLFPMEVKTLKNSGFEVKTISESINPIYSIKYSENEHPIIGFSKKLYDDFNPKSEFAAIMTCSQADEGSPFIAGAEKRIQITFEDPKAFDNIPR